MTESYNQTENPTKVEADEGGEQVEIPKIPLSRRSILLTMAIGTAGGNSIVGTAAADDTEIEVDAEDGYGGNPDGVPEHLEISEGSEIIIETPESVSEGQIIITTLSLRPEYVENADWEEVGEAAFQETGQDDYIIQGTDFPDEGRDLFNHSDVDPSDFEIEKDLEQLEDKENRYVERVFELKVEIRVRGEEPFYETDDISFSVYFALTGGLGANLGYNLGKKAPLEKFEGEV